MVVAGGGGEGIEFLIFLNLSIGDLDLIIYTNIFFNLIHLYI